MAKKKRLTPRQATDTDRLIGYLTAAKDAVISFL